ncbi:aminopeptidase [Pedobacter quisquiliarum]|uniref:Aminopeptidase n=1 Tax=Pedobacter quisquiliarum TaxID=1834438 RepID=A0A916U082_9SPHI|nr:M28 family peptidase [Pedobacter quisquiliarum]GGC54079.1 aminopeptidase [Pedobacter quisquiliarum]
MKFRLFIPLALLMSCQTVKKAEEVQGANSLLEDVKTLSSDAYQGRKTGTDGAALARTFLKKRLSELGLSNYGGLQHFEQPFKAKDRTGKMVDAKNLIAYIPGKSPEIIVISGHYDHLGVINEEIYNGADDNASGVAAMLNIAAHYKKSKPDHTLVFAFFDAGELDWQGSGYFVDHAPFDLKKVLLNVNLDMISHNEKNELYAAGTFTNPQLKKYLTHTQPNVKIMLGHDNPEFNVDDWTNQSDQGAFNAKGIPFLYFGVEDHKDYHKASDKFENIQPAFFIDAAEAILEIVDNVDKDRDIQSMYKQKLQMKKQ